MALNKVVLITGASSGIGEGIARELAAAGAKLVIGARRMDRLEALAEELRHAGAEVIAHPLNVTDRESVAAFAEAGRKAFGQIDVNIKGVLYGIAAVLPDMTRAKSGHIINIASIGALAVSPTAAVYCATKFAVRAISDGLRQENKDIRVTCIHPGVVESELANTITDPAAAELMAGYRAIALKPDAIGRAVRFAIEQPGDVDINEIVVRPTAG